MALSFLLTGCRTPATTAAAPVNLAGQWTWTCCEGNFKGEMTLQQDGGKITGRIFDANDTTGGAVAGGISDNTVTFTRTWGDGLRQDFTLAVSADGKKLAGKFDGTQDTRYGNLFEATRK